MGVLLQVVINNFLSEVIVVCCYSMMESFAYVLCVISRSDFARVLT